jgi:hypothetical protein
MSSKNKRKALAAKRKGKSRKKAKRTINFTPFWSLWQSCAFPSSIDLNALHHHLSETCSRLYSSHSVCPSSRSAYKEVVSHALEFIPVVVVNLICAYALWPDPYWFHDALQDNEGNTCLVYARGPCIPRRPSIPSHTDANNFGCYCTLAKEKPLRYADLLILTNLKRTPAWMTLASSAFTNWNIYMTSWLFLDLETNQITSDAPRDRKGLYLWKGLGRQKKGNI